MNKKTKKAIVGLMGALGLIAIILGLFTSLLGFIDSVVIALVLWILAGVLKTFFGMKK